MVIVQIIIKIVLFGSDRKYIILQNNCRQVMKIDV